VRFSTNEYILKPAIFQGKVIDYEVLRRPGAEGIGIWGLIRGKYF
jgi:hypothetical protein